MAKYFSRAITQCYNSDMINRHGSVLTTSGKICSEGYNHSRNRWKGYMNSDITLCTTHAEMHSILKYKKKKYPLRGCKEEEL